MKNSYSSLQKNFQTQQTFKRNFRYFNASQIKNLQNQDCIKRRKPIGQSDVQTQRKMNSSFTNSTTVLSSRVQQEIYKFTKRIYGQYSPQKSQYQKQYQSPSSPKLKSFSIEKMLNRNSANAVNQSKQNHDQRLFNNFKIQKLNLSKTCDFSKLKGRNLDYSLKNINDIYHETKKAHDYCFYKDSVLKAKVNYKLQNKVQKRYFFIQKKPIDIPATVLNPEKVDQGLKIATNFKYNNINNGKISNFYENSGRQMPGQFDMRSMNHLTNFYKDRKQKLIQPKIDYTIKNIKEQLIGRKRQAARKPKNPNFTREEVCDQKFFKQQFALKNKSYQ